MEAINYLKKVPIFSDLSEEDLQMMSEIILVRKYRKNMIIFMEGEPGDGLYFIKQGRVKIYKTTEDGREQILHFLQNGDVFAEVVLFDGGPFPATAEVLEDSTIGIIRNQDIDRFIKNYPDIAVRLLKMMSKKLRQAQMQIRDLALKDTYGRIVGMLYKLSKEYGEQCEAGTRITIPLSRQELANLIGTSRETVTRLLGDLKKSKIIELDKQEIVIINEKKLKQWM